MVTDAHILEYKRFFSNNIQAGTKISSEDTPILMHNLLAIGKLKDSNIAERAEEIKRSTPEELLKKAEKFYQYAYIRQAFFYYTLAHLKKGTSLENILGEIKTKFPINNVPGEYQLHKLHLEDRCNDPTTIFIDWDGNMELNGGLRQKTEDFLHYFASKKDHEGKKLYSLIITSASYNLMKKVNKYKKILANVDAIYSIPGIMHPTDKRYKRVAGKLYTDICDRLRIKNNRSIIITDTWADRSAEASCPILTLVTPSTVSADYWIKAVEYLQEKGKGNFATAESKILKKLPEDIIDGHKKEGWKVYQTTEPGTRIKTDLFLEHYNSAALSHCFFMHAGELPTQPPQNSPASDSKYL